MRSCAPVLRSLSATWGKHQLRKRSFHQFRIQFVTLRQYGILKQTQVSLALRGTQRTLQSPSLGPVELQAPECSELHDPMGASCWIRPGKLEGESDCAELRDDTDRDDYLKDEHAVLRRSICM